MIIARGRLATEENIGRIRALVSGRQNRSR
jgi:hypothetical protein